MKSIIFIFLIVCCTAHSGAAESSAPLSLTAQTTYGSYGGSAERKDLVSEVATLAYETGQFGASVAVRNWKLFRTSPLGNLSGITGNASLYARKKIGTEGFVGASTALTYLTGNDSNTDRILIPFGAITCKTPDGGQYFDIGYAVMDYRDSTANQVTATYGIALFDRYVWSQTRLYYIDLSKPVQGKGLTFAAEERLTWYVVPAVFSVTLSGMVGQRVYAYDPDLRIAYTMPDIQRESGGLTATWEITPSLRLFGDVTYETYEKRSINNSYSATYGTVGLTYTF
jgi:hypothetical protein